jgi:glycosyltransferase involved in cell wall biosynthesis
MTIHVLDNFLPYHTAGIEIYVFRLCLSNPDLNKVLITGEVNDSYFYNGVEVFRVKEDKDFYLTFNNILINHKISNLHYHQFEGGKLYDSKTINQIKKLNIKLTFTFHLVQYYCSTLKLKLNNKTECKIKANYNSCLKCHVQTNYLDKLPKGLRYYRIFSILSPIPKVGNLLKESAESVKNILKRFEYISTIFDELITINKDFYQLLLPFENLQNKLKLMPPYYQESKLRNRSDQNPKKLIFLGRIEKSKGIDRLVEMAKSINDESVLIHLYGQLNDSKYSVDYFDNISKITKTEISYRGILVPEMVPEVLEDYDFLIHPSQIAEMTPLVIHEAIKAGIPVIGNDIFGINTYIENGKNGWLIDFNSKKITEDFMALFNNKLEEK